MLRASQDWLYRDLRLVVAARSLFSFGIDALDATTHGCAFDAAGICTIKTAHSRGVPDAHFITWLGQFQLVRRFDPWGVEALLRADLQLAADPLFSLEQYSVGGEHTVRGYRENRLVRDNGLTSSLEVRVPVWVDAAHQVIVQLAPFCDAGRSWNTERDEPSPRTLASVGIGLRTTWRHLHGELFGGHQIKDVDKPDDRALQDEGVHFSLVASF
ncbi:MAG TPA: ShlB/FhaC/HecB family hemolysin secretion/activation protein [Myxococcota bacterium]|nr:ShlB/FhaC/HecB family hemolysin secretion/activation protein [Myxococcota bacterium]